jgi:hypothetical protein
VTVKGRAVTLTSHEFRVLSYLMHQHPRMVTRGELTDHIYAQNAERDRTRSKCSSPASAESRALLHPDRPRPRLPD